MWLILARTVLSQFGHERAATIAEPVSAALDLRSSLFSSVSWFVHGTQLPSVSGYAVQVPRLAARLSQDSLLLSKAFREDLR